MQEVAEVMRTEADTVVLQKHEVRKVAQMEKQAAPRGAHDSGRTGGEGPSRTAAPEVRAELERRQLKAEEALPAQASPGPRNCEPEARLRPPEDVRQCWS